MKQKPRVKGEADVGSTTGFSHICSDSKADRLGEQVRDAHTGLSPKAERSETPWSRGLGRGTWGPQTHLLGDQGLPHLHQGFS